MTRWLLAMPVLLLLGGCPPTPVTLKTVTLAPSAQRWASWEKDFTNAWCYIPLPGQGLFLNGTGPETSGDGELISGFDDIYDSGSGPFACTYQQQRQYRGHLAFDLSQFDAVSVATLTFNVDTSLTANGGVHVDGLAQSYATTLGMSTGTMDLGNGPFFWAYDDEASLPSCIGGVIKPDCSLGVGQQVSAWVSKSHANYGFIIAGPILDFPGNLPSDNNATKSFYQLPASGRL